MSVTHNTGPAAQTLQMHEAETVDMVYVDGDVAYEGKVEFSFLVLHLECYFAFERNCLRMKLPTSNTHVCMSIFAQPRWLFCDMLGGYCAPEE